MSKKPNFRIKDLGLRAAVRDAEDLLAVAERDVRDAQRALDTLRRGQKQAEGSAITEGAGRRARRRAAELLKRVERNARDKRKILGRLRSQVARVDASLLEFRAGLKPAPQSPPPIDGMQLRAARSILELSQKQMAAQLGISPARLSKLERQGLTARDNPELLATLVRNLASLGIELISTGIYVGSGGPGVRLKRRRARKVQESAPQKPKQTARSRRRKALAA